MSRTSVKKAKQEKEDDDAIYGDWDDEFKLTCLVQPDANDIQSAIIVESSYLEYCQSVRERMNTKDNEETDEDLKIQQAIDTEIKEQSNVDVSPPILPPGPTLKPGGSFSSLDNRASFETAPQSQVQVAPNVFRQAQTSGNSIAALPHSSRTFARAHNVETLASDAALTILPTSSPQNLSAQSGSSGSNKNTQRIPVVLPSCSAWFSQHSIHAIEREQLDSIFFASKSSAAKPMSSLSLGCEEREKKYKIVRNQIIALYRRDPSKRLTFADIRRVIDVDVSLLARVYAFLDHWGLINFQAEENASASTIQALDSILLSTSNKQNKETSKTHTQMNEGKKNKNDQSVSSTSGPFSCASCSKICVYSYYVLRGSTGPRHGVSLLLLTRCAWCVTCFHEGNFPPNLSASNFVRVDVPGYGTEAEGWNEEETLRLFDAIERFSEDWAAVAAYVGGGKTAANCVERFISFPIVETLAAPVKRRRDTDAKGLGDWMQLVDNAKREKNFFSDTSNGLETLLAMIASTVHPSVAGAAAKAALDEATHLQLVMKSETEGIVKKDSSTASTNVVGESGSDIDLAIDMEAMCAAAVGAAVGRVKELAVKEKVEAGKLIPTIIELKLKRLELKVAQMNALEALVANEAASMASKVQMVRGGSGVSGDNTAMQVE